MCCLAQDQILEVISKCDEPSIQADVINWWAQTTTEAFAIRLFKASSCDATTLGKIMKTLSDPLKLLAIPHVGSLLPSSSQVGSSTRTPPVPLSSQVAQTPPHGATHPPQTHPKAVTVFQPPQSIPASAPVHYRATPLPHLPAFLPFPSPVAFPYASHPNYINWGYNNPYPPFPIQSQMAYTHAVGKMASTPPVRRPPPATPSITSTRGRPKPPIPDTPSRYPFVQSAAQLGLTVRDNRPTGEQLSMAEIYEKGLKAVRTVADAELRHWRSGYELPWMTHCREEGACAVKASMQSEPSLTLISLSPRP